MRVRIAGALGIYAARSKLQLRMTGIYLAEQLVLGGPDFTVSYLQRLAGVTPDEVERMLRIWFVDRPVLALLVEPAIAAATATDAPAAAATVDRTAEQ